MILRGGFGYFLSSLIGLICIQQVFGLSPKPYAETQTLRIADPGPWDDLGYSIAVGGGSMISGAINVQNPSLPDDQNDIGAAYVYRQDATGRWIVDGVLTPSDGEHNDAFGWEVDIDGSNAVVGVPRQDAVGDSAGAAYFYHRDSVGNWQQTNKLVAHDGGAGELFGSVVAIDGQVAAVGAFRHDRTPPGSVGRERGAVYIYEQDGNNNWNFTTKLQPSGLWNNAYFGYRLDMCGDTLVATLPNVINQNTNWRGGAYVYRKSGPNWTLMDRVFADDPLEGGDFGTNVSLGDGRLIVGASAAQGTDGRGGAYIFEEDNLGQWVQTAKLIPHDLDQRWFFGAEVELYGNLAAVAAYSSPSGLIDAVVYLFEYDGGQWNEIATLTSQRALHSFGFSLAAYEGQVFVGSEINAPGAIHIFSQIPEAGSALLLASALSAFALKRRL